MSKYPEIPSATYTEKGGVRYFVRKFGLNNKVFEEEIHPIPIGKVIRTMNADGTEDTTKRKTEKITK